MVKVDIKNWKIIDDAESTPGMSRQYSVFKDEVLNKPHDKNSNIIEYINNSEHFRVITQIDENTAYCEFI